MSIQIITGLREVSSVTSADDAALYRGIFGPNDYVLKVGNKFSASIIDNNHVKLLDGDLLIQGHQARIRTNDYETVTIDNGVATKKRHDLIVARYVKNSETGIEEITLLVIKGETADIGVDPEVIRGDIPAGDTEHEFALYRVKLDGLSIEAVEPMFDIVKSVGEVLADFGGCKIIQMTETAYNLLAPEEIDDDTLYFLTEE